MIPMLLRPLLSADYEAVMALWTSVEGMGISEADSRASVERFLDRNPGLSFVAEIEGLVAGAVLCGHDGRRGFLYHLAVAPHHRRKGIGSALANRCLAALQALSIDKCHLFVFNDNLEAHEFWEALGWAQRNDLIMMSCGTALKS